jgi:hypothetical protein
LRRDVLGVLSAQRTVTVLVALAGEAPLPSGFYSKVVLHKHWRMGYFPNLCAGEGRRTLRLSVERDLVLEKAQCSNYVRVANAVIEICRPIRRRREYARSSVRSAPTARIVYSAISVRIAAAN